MCSFGDFVFVLLPFLYVIYRIDLIGVDLLGFIEIHPDMAEDEILCVNIQQYSLRCVNIQQCYFWLFPEALGTLYSVFSNVLQTSTNTLNLSMSLFCGLSCFGSWYTKHSFGSKAFFSFQVKLEMLSIFRLLVLSKITLIHLMCMLV